MGAKRKRHHEIGHRRGRATGRAARRAGFVVRVIGFARFEVSEFGGDGFAHDDAARGFDGRHTRGIHLRYAQIVDV